MSSHASECCVCMDVQADCFLLPCNHTGFCVRCMLTLLRNDNFRCVNCHQNGTFCHVCRSNLLFRGLWKCPLCRRSIQMIVINSLGIMDAEDILYLIGLVNRMSDLPSAQHRLQTCRAIAVLTYTSAFGLPVPSQVEDKFHNLEKVLTEQYDVLRLEWDPDGNGEGIFI